LRIFFTLILLAVLAFGGWMAWALLTPVTPSGQTFVLLRPGYSSRHIANELQSAGVIRSARAFAIWHRIHHRRSLKAGEYLFEKTANALDIHQRLVQGDIYVHTVVIPEGYNMFEIAQAIQQAGLGSGEDFLKVAMSDTALIADVAPEAKSLEGYLFPSTYEFTRTQTMEEMASAMVKQFRQVAREIELIQTSQTQNPLAQASQGNNLQSDAQSADRQPNEAQRNDVQKNDVQKIVTLASIIEKETAVPDERPRVASVYYNRLGRKMALQADPSVIYAELLDGAYPGALHHADMQFKSAYNTYAHAGLPPGPIGNPGKTSLEAAMHPAATDYFYFVSAGNSHHRFAHGLEEHNRNVAAYRKIVNQR